MNISNEGIEFIKRFEGVRLEAYQDSARVWTIGYGHTGTARPGMKITMAEADKLLRADLEWAENCVNTNVDVQITQTQYDALCSFVFNLGCRAFQRSTLLRKLNSGDYEGAADEFGRWVMAGGRKLRGLVRRRHDETALFEGDRTAYLG